VLRRKEINEHRKAIEDKKKEIVELKKQRDDLEDALRHAGGLRGGAQVTRHLKKSKRLYRTAQNFVPPFTPRRERASVKR